MGETNKFNFLQIKNINTRMYYKDEVWGLMDTEFRHYGCSNRYKRGISDLKSWL